MKTIVIRGGRSLHGTVRAHGSKNALLPILAAAVMAEGEITLPDCPPLRDVQTMLEILREMGCECGFHGAEIHILADPMHSWHIDDVLVSRLRSSIFMLGPLLARFGKAELGYPGGCDIGIRPIDLHLQGLRSLGVLVKETDGHIICSCDRLKGSEVNLDYPSVGATENIMMAAVYAEGATVINNAAKEPEIVDLQNFLNAMGARVSGGGSTQVVIHGVQKLRGCHFQIMPDRIVTGTFMIASAMTNGDITVSNAIRQHVAILSAKLEDCGCKVLEDNGVRVIGPTRPNSAHVIETMPYPGFPTDLQSPMMSLQSIAQGTCVLVENVFENRFRLAGELRKMGADITIRDRTAVIRGVEQLHGATVFSHDLRGGAALILAGLNADGTTVIYDQDMISRGYWHLEEDLKKLGADILEES